MDKKNIFAEAGMLVRKPIDTVFQAFIDPKITTKFWFTKSTGKLEQGKTLNWIWEMYDHSVEVHVKKIVPNETIEIEWGNEGHTNKVTWSFESFGKSKTFVTVINDEFKGNQDEKLSSVRDSTGGFSLVLAGLKAYLEHGIQLNLIDDRFPEELFED